MYSSFHIAQLQVGLVDPIRLGQAKIVKVRKKNTKKLQDTLLWEKCKGITRENKHGCDVFNPGVIHASCRPYIKAFVFVWLS